MNNNGIVKKALVGVAIWPTFLEFPHCKSAEGRKLQEKIQIPHLPGAIEMFKRERWTWKAAMKANTRAQKARTC